MQVFPKFPGLTWDVHAIPTFNTQKQQAASGRMTRSARWQYPIWKLQASFEVLDDVTVGGDGFTDFERLLGFFLSRQGDFDAFLVKLSDLTQKASHSTFGDAVTPLPQQIGVGDGTTTDFQLVKNWGGFLDVITDPIGTPTVYTKTGGGAWTPTAAFTLQPNGIIRMNAAPAAAVLVGAAGSFYWRMTWDGDEADFSTVAKTLFDLQQMNLATDKPR